MDKELTRRQFLNILAILDGDMYKANAICDIVECLYPNKAAQEINKKDPIRNYHVNWIIENDGPF